jgi:pimeloyl-ACP methyl ester carboxylesterase
MPKTADAISRSDARPADASRGAVQVTPPLAGYEKRNITIPGASGPVPATVIDVGSGPTFVFLHGLVGLNDHWEEVVKRFSANARCVMLEIPLLDLKGDDCSIQGVSTLTARFLDTYFANTGDLPVGIVGNSFGGHVALRMAIERPDLVRALVLAGASGLIEKSMVADVQIRPSREWLSRKIGELFFDPKFMRESDLDRAHAALTSRSGARAMVKLSRSARRNHLGSKLAQIKAPTLLIWGREDIVTPPEAADGFKRSIPNSTLVWFDRCGHAPMIECPQRFADAMTAFAHTHAKA